MGKSERKEKAKRARAKCASGESVAAVPGECGRVSLAAQRCANRRRKFGIQICLLLGVDEARRRRQFRATGSSLAAGRPANWWASWRRARELLRAQNPANLRSRRAGVISVRRHAELAPLYRGAESFGRPAGRLAGWLAADCIPAPILLEIIRAVCFGRLVRSLARKQFSIKLTS